MRSSLLINVDELPVGLLLSWSKDTSLNVTTTEMGLLADFYDLSAGLFSLLPLLEQYISLHNNLKVGNFIFSKLFFYYKIHPTVLTNFNHILLGSTPQATTNRT